VRPSWLHTSSFVSDSAWLFAAADIFVSASRHEGQSSAIGEALACGLPVVMSDIPGTAMWGGAPHMLTFGSEDAAALGSRLEQLLGDSVERRAAAGARDRDWVLKNFAIDAWDERICAIYENLL
jgi:glycosyltransferase involved in cell wall biosynthesis